MRLFLLALAFTLCPMLAVKTAATSTQHNLENCHDEIETKEQLDAWSMGEASYTSIAFCSTLYINKTSLCGFNERSLDDGRMKRVLPPEPRTQTRTQTRTMMSQVLKISGDVGVYFRADHTNVISSTHIERLVSSISTVNMLTHVTPHLPFYSYGAHTHTYGATLTHMMPHYCFLVSAHPSFPHNTLDCPGCNYRFSMLASALDSWHSLRSLPLASS